MRRGRLRSERGHRGERGAVSAIVAVLMSVVLVGSAAFAVDLGLQRAARRDMQAVADLVALDLARQLDGRTVSSLSATMTAEMAKSRSRNTGSIGDAPTLTYQLGTVSGGRFTAGSATSVPSAVRVTATTTVPFSFGGTLGTGRGGASRAAVAQASSGACFTTGSYAVRVKLGDAFIVGPLLKALGSDVNLSLLDVQGLAGVDVKLLDLVNTGVVAGGFDEFAAANLTVGQLYLATARVLANNGGDAAQIALLNRLATVAIKDVNVRVADIVGLDTTGAAALGASVNLLDLVSTTAFVANGTNVLAIPSLDVNLAGISRLSASLYVGQKPTLVCGRSGQAVGRSAQVGLDLKGNLADINLGVGVISAPLSISVRLTPSAAALQKVACLSGAKKLDFLVTNGLLSVDIVVGDTANRDALAVKVLGINVVSGYVRISTSPKGGDTVAGSITVSNENYAGSTPLSTGSGSIGVPNLNPDPQLAVLDNVPLVGYLVNTLLGGLVNGVVVPLVTSVVNPLVGAIDTLLLSPLLEALGINVAGADVAARPIADCGIPRLVG